MSRKKAVKRKKTRAAKKEIDWYKKLIAEEMQLGPQVHPQRAIERAKRFLNEPEIRIKLNTLRKFDKKAAEGLKKFMPFILTNPSKSTPPPARGSTKTGKYYAGYELARMMIDSAIYKAIPEKNRKDLEKKLEEIYKKRRKKVKSLKFSK